ncbi:hypothetical protein R9X47_28065 [Wukongibacter baidiensis]|uniref:hypothetical protein n=1 Tax=Wukongibacter baidiensis TaxID=1723361 RepID=UPI003D7F4EB1
MDNEKVRISKLSIIAFCLFLLGTISFFGGASLFNTGFIPEDKGFLISGTSILLQLSAFTLGIIDLFKKNRKKILSVITVIFSGLPTIVFLLILIIVQLYAKTPK